MSAPARNPVIGTRAIETVERVRDILAYLDGAHPVLLNAQSSHGLWLVMSTLGDALAHACEQLREAREG